MTRSNSITSSKVLRTKRIGNASVSCSIFISKVFSIWLNFSRFSKTSSRPRLRWTWRKRSWSCCQPETPIEECWVTSSNHGMTSRIRSLSFCQTLVTIRLKKASQFQPVQEKWWTRFTIRTSMTSIYRWPQDQKTSSSSSETQMKSRSTRQKTKCTS